MFSRSGMPDKPRIDPLPLLKRFSPSSSFAPVCFWPLLCLWFLFTVGCSHSPQVSETTRPQPTKAPPIEYGQFPPETLYALLVAELAADRNRFDIALGNYSQQAQKTRDSGIAERATYLAGFLGARQATLANAILWSEIEPDNPKARLIVANELSQLGRLVNAFEEALPLLDQSIQQRDEKPSHTGRSPTADNDNDNDNDNAHSTSNLEIFQTIAAKSKTLPESDRAVLEQKYDEALKQFPDQPELSVGKGLLLTHAQKDGQALQIGQAILKQHPNHIGAITLTTQTLLRLDRSAEAIKLLEQRLKRNPDDDDIRIRYARALIVVDKERAKVQFQKLSDNQPKNPDHLFALALICLDQQAYDEAKIHLTKLLQQPSPDKQSSAHFYLGEIASMKGHRSLALEHYRSVGPSNDFVTAINKTSRLLFLADNPEKVGEYFDELRQKYAYLSERLFLIEAQILQQYQQASLSLSVLEKGLMSFPNSTSLLFSRAMTNGSLGNDRRMEMDLATVIQQDEDHAPALNALGYAWAERAVKLEEARALIARALSLRPAEAAYIDSMGWVEYRLGRFEAAIEQLHKAMKLKPDHEIAAHLGEVLWVTGQTDAAYAAWQKGLSLKPGSPPVLSTVQRLTGQELPPSLTANDTESAIDKNR